MKTVRKMSDDLLGTRTMQVAFGNLDPTTGRCPARPACLARRSRSSALAGALLSWPSAQTGVDAQPLLGAQRQPIVPDLAEPMEEVGRVMDCWEQRALRLRAPQLGP